MGAWPVFQAKGLVELFPPTDCSWTWKKICAVKDLFKAGCPSPYDWKFQGKSVFTVSLGYHWLVGGTKVPWDKVIWARASLPRHAFISWIYVHRRLPTKLHLARFVPRSNVLCALCHIADEDDTHLFLSCPFAKEVWDSLSHWWPMPFSSSICSHMDIIASLSAYKAPKAHKQITYAIFPTGNYSIWYARNQTLFKNLQIPASQTVNMIKNQVRHRILFLNSISCISSSYLDAILS